MGTLVRITVYTPDEQAAKDAFRAAFDRIRDLDAHPLGLPARQRAESDHQTAVGRAVPVSEDLFAVLARRRSWRRRPAARSISRRGPSIRLWREARKTARVPDRRRVAGRRQPQRLPQASPGRRSIGP